MRLNFPRPWRSYVGRTKARWRSARPSPKGQSGDTPGRTGLIGTGSIAMAVASLGLLLGAGAAGFGGAGSNIHVVVPGDTLWAISQADGLTVAQLAAANNMNPNDLLLVGRRLIIPTPGRPANTAPSSPPSRTSSPSASSSSGRSGPNPWTFCSTFVPQTGPRGVLPWLLQHTPPRLALQPVFEHWANYYGLWRPLLEAIAWQESGWQQNVVSSAGAVGVGQILPSSATFISSQLVGERLNIKSASDNIRMSAALLAFLAGVENNNRCDVIAAYYEGAINLSHFGVLPQAQSYVASVEALIPEFE